MNSILNLHSVKVFSKPGIEQAPFDFYRRLHSQEPANILLQQELLSDLQAFLEEEVFSPVKINYRCQKLLRP